MLETIQLIGASIYSLIFIIAAVLMLAAFVVEMYCVIFRGMKMQNNDYMYYGHYNGRR